MRGVTSALIVSTKTRIEPARMPGAESGSVTEVKTCGAARAQRRGGGFDVARHVADRRDQHQHHEGQVDMGAGR